MPSASAALTRRWPRFALTTPNDKANANKYGHNSTLRPIEARERSVIELGAFCDYSGPPSACLLRMPTGLKS